LRQFPEPLKFLIETDNRRGGELYGCAVADKSADVGESFDAAALL
jgi:hypothetical protein